jgi:hypothetical protein
MTCMSQLTCDKLELTPSSGQTLEVRPLHDRHAGTVLRLPHPHPLPLTFPQLAVIISSICWTLLLAFPQLILKEAPQTGQTVPNSSPEVPALARLPLVHDLSLYAAPGLTLLLDFFLFERKYSPAAACYAAPLASIACCVGYSVWPSTTERVRAFLPVLDGWS